MSALIGMPSPASTGSGEMTPVGIVSGWDVAGAESAGAFPATLRR